MRAHLDRIDLEEDEVRSAFEESADGDWDLQERA